MKNAMIALMTGFIFSFGLGLSNMTQPQKVIGFLDFFGHWDPSLIFVMIGAIGTHFVTYKIIRKRTLPIFFNEWHVPTKTQITPSLIIGSLIFGAGWGLAGYCPGPAVMSLASFEVSPALFVFSMLAGMTLFNTLNKKFNFNR